MESFIDKTARAFASTSKLVVKYLKDTNRQIVELGAKVEDNQKSSQNNKERIQGNSHELVSVKAHLELHEDKLGRLDEQFKEQENTLITQGKLVERLEEQAQQ